jgi:hypothetical protein
VSADPGTEVRRALALLKSTAFIMGTRDRAYDKIVKDAVGHLENARAGLGIGPPPDPLVEAAALEPSIVEWIYGAADAGLATADAMADSATSPTKAEVLAGALLSIREWAARLLKKPAPEGSSGSGGQISTPRGLE